MAKSPSLSLLCHFLFIFLVSYAAINVSHSATVNPTELVDKICSQTSNYTLCVEFLYSDPRTPDADPYTLADISFRLTLGSARNTQDYIAGLLNSSSHDQDDCAQCLQRCSNDYDKALTALELAFNDLNSETFDRLADLANDAAQAADDCQVAFKGAPSQSLAKGNHDLKGLCEICANVAKFFTGGFL